MRATSEIPYEFSFFLAEFRAEKFDLTGYFKRLVTIEANKRLRVIKS
jgi:hypothetical protein